MEIILRIIRRIRKKLSKKQDSEKKCLLESDYTNGGDCYGEFSVGEDIKSSLELTENGRKGFIEDFHIGKENETFLELPQSFYYNDGQIKPSHCGELDALTDKGGERIQCHDIDSIRGMHYFGTNERNGWRDLDMQEACLPESVGGIHERASKKDPKGVSENSVGSNDLLKCQENEKFKKRFRKFSMSEQSSPCFKEGSKTVEFYVNKKRLIGNVLKIQIQQRNVITNCDGPTIGWKIRKRKGQSIAHGTPSKKLCGPIWCPNRFTECWDDLIFGIDPKKGIKGNKGVAVNEVNHQKHKAVVFKYRRETPVNVFEMGDTAATYSEITTIVENCNPTVCSLERCLKQSMTLIKAQENATHIPIRYVNESTSIFANIPKTNLELFRVSFRKTLVVDMADTSFVMWYFEFLKDSCCVLTCGNSMQKPCHTNFELFSMLFRKTLFVDMTEGSLVMWCLKFLKDCDCMQTCQDMSIVRSEALNEITLTYTPQGRHAFAKRANVSYRISAFTNRFGDARLNPFLNISKSSECHPLFEIFYKNAPLQNMQFQIKRVWNGYFSVFCVNSNWHTTNEVILKLGASKSPTFADGSFNRDVSFHRDEITQTRKKNTFLQSGRENVSKMIGVRFRHKKSDNVHSKQKQNHKSELCCDLDEKYLSHKSVTYNRDIRKCTNCKILDKKPNLKIKKEKKNGFDLNYEGHNENVGEIDHSLNVTSEDTSSQNRGYLDHYIKRETGKRDIGCPETSYLPSDASKQVKKSKKKGFLKKIFKRSSSAIKEKNDIQLDEQMKTPKCCDEVIREVGKPKKIKKAKKKEVSPMDGRNATTGCCDDKLNGTFEPKKAKKVWKFKVPKWLKGKKHAKKLP